jgi:hypothetical protein
MPSTSQEIGIHICPKCRKDVTSGKDANGLPALCSTCDSQRKLLASLSTGFHSKRKGFDALSQGKETPG